jgi:hypothetical protein
LLDHVVTAVGPLLTRGAEAEDWCGGVRGLVTVRSPETHKPASRIALCALFVAGGRARTTAGGISRSKQADRLANPSGAPVTSKSQIRQRLGWRRVLSRLMVDIRVSVEA